MTREFQVLYRMTDQTGTAAAVPVGAVLSCMAMAEAEDQLVAQFQAAGFHVVGVNFVRAVVDWSRPNFNRDEAAEYLRWTSQTLSINKGNGEIPFADVGRGIYPQRLLAEYVERKLNPAGKEIAEETREAAAA